jgi:hypothetical protein
MTAHTPGPWTIVAREVMEEDGSVYPKHIVGGELEHTVCFLEAQYVARVAVQQPGTHWDTTPQKEANARLIAAAPDLLAVALYSATALRLSGVEANAHSDNPIEWLLHQTEAAIAKAKGEHS